MGACCDNCEACLTTTSTVVPSRPQTPPNSTIQFIFESGLSPSKSPRHNGKHPMVPSSQGPATRRDEHLKNAKDLLFAWRLDTWMEDYSDKVPYGPSALLPDAIIEKIASNRRLATQADLAAVGWSGSRMLKHGEDVLRCLKELDAKADAERRLMMEHPRSGVKRAKDRQTRPRPSSLSRKSVLGPSAAPNSKPLKTEPLNASVCIITPSDDSDGDSLFDVPLSHLLSVPPYAHHSTSSLDHMPTVSFECLTPVVPSQSPNPNAKAGDMASTMVSNVPHNGSAPHAFIVPSHLRHNGITSNSNTSSTATSISRQLSQSSLGHSPSFVHKYLPSVVPSQPPDPSVVNAPHAFFVPSHS